MKKFKKRYIILMGILSFFIVIIFWGERKSIVKSFGVDISKIPLNIGEWKGEEVLVDEETKDILETEKVLMRRYVNLKGEVIFLAIVYYKDSRVALHLPEGCLSGQGSRLVDRRVIKIEIPWGKDFFATKIITTSNRGNQLILYYFQTGTLCTNSYLSLRWQMMKNKLMGKGSSGALVRFSISIKNDRPRNMKTLKDFIIELVPVLSQYLI